ncbi:sugar-binding protein [Ruminiclostridium cellulolyticum]|uniref:Carbohydrate-binding family 9 n=1 Tax=Ruminiclostridium cellulolyticum (strain ATCC 35319 / DSM 5812 / JCM 6584 / H10) TaxID=394503 RepID=B8I995_RUMCH|nr:sugar-binding protein [Ruminiclostridium cellulolyticum]ACL75355.1 Carbohydrate-binding family 9 [Ruminiclostridium cellulolyticum H10]
MKLVGWYQYRKCLSVFLALIIAFGSFFSLAASPVAAEGETNDPVQATFYVSPAGDDNNPGTIDEPFKTLAKAKEHVRTLPKTGGDIVVQIADGFYPLDETLVFDKDDSGSASCTIRYEAAPGAKPVISGGEMLEKGVWTEATDLTQTGGLTAYKTTLNRDEKLRAIYVNDKRANMTLSGTITSADRTTEGTPTVSFDGTDNPWAWQNGNNIRAAIVFSESVGLTPDTKNPQNIEAESMGGSTARWARPFVCFASAESAPEASGKVGGTMLRFQMPYAAISQSLSNNTQYNPGNNQVIRNAFEFLNKRGDFYFDQAESTLYYIPLEGEDINTADVVIPKLETVVDLRGIPVGDRLNPVEGSDEGRVTNITFDGLRFAHTDYKLYELTGTYTLSDGSGPVTTSSRGFASVQGCIVNKVYFPSYINWHETFYRGYDIPPAAVMVNAARNIKVLNGEIALTGFNGIHLENDVKDCEVTGNYIADTLSSGVVVGHPTHIYENDKPTTHESAVKVGETPIGDWAGVDKEKYTSGTEAVPQDIFITNNFLYRNCYGFPGANSLTSFYTTNMQVLHNYLYDSTYGAMSIGWGWCEYDGYGYTNHGTDKNGSPYAGTHETSLARSPDISTTSRDNKINYNRVEEICTVVNDSGAIYSLGRQGDPGNLPDGGTWDTVDSLTSSPVTDPNSNWHPDNWTNFTEMNYNFLDPNPNNKPTTSNNWTNGFHPDEGSTFIKMIGNVVQSKLSHSPGRSRLYEFNNWKRKSDMIAIDGFVDGNNDQNGGPRITFKNYKSEERIWPVRGNEIVLNSGLTDEYTHMIPRSLIADTEFELASNVIMGKGETLNRRGLLKPEDTVWLAPADTTEFVEGSNMTKAAGDEKTIVAPSAAGEYKLYIVYADGRETATSKFTAYVDASASAVNVEDGKNYEVSAVRPLKLTLSEDFTYTLNGEPVVNGYDISTEGSWTLVLSTPTAPATKTINFTTTVSLANKLLPADVSVAPGGTVRFAYDLDDATKKIWISSSSGGHFDGGDDESVASGDMLGMAAPVVPGPYVIFVLAEDGEVLSQSHARVVVRDMTPVDIPREGLDLWLKADEGVTTDDTGNVIGWKNMGGVAATLVPADVPGTGGDNLGPANGNPTLKKDVYDYVNFDAASRPLKAKNFKDYNDKSEMTIYTLVKPTTTANNSSDQSGLVYFGLNENYNDWAANDGWSGINLGVGTNRITLRFGNTVQWSGGGSTFTTDIAGLTSVRAQLNGTNREVYVNNISIGSDSNSAALKGNRSDLGVGYTMSAVTPYRFLGQVAQILIYDRVLEADEIVKVEAYFDEYKKGNGGIANPVSQAVDKTLLTALINDVNNLDDTIYTVDSWNTFESALSDAKTAASNQEIDQEAADNAYFALRSAFKALTLLPSGIGTSAYGTPVLGGAELDPLWNTTVTLPIFKHLTMANGPANGTAKVLWDDTNLYVLVRIKDPVLNSSNSAAHEQDSVEIFVDETNSKAASYGAGMGQYRINYLNAKSFNPSSISTGFESFAKVVDGGYYIETKIPFKTGVPEIPKNGHVIGFDVQINDAGATGGRQDIVMWHDETGNSWSNGSQWGVVTLVKADSNDTAAPTWPEGSTMTAPEIGINAVTLNWSPAQDDVGVTSYEIYNGTDMIGKVAGNINSFEAANLNAETEYTFTVQAVDQAGNTSTDGPSVTFTTLPDDGQGDTEAPYWPEGSSIAVSEVTETGLTLTWPAALDNTAVTGYVIYDGATQVAVLAGDVTSYAISGLKAGTEYTFTIKAKDASLNWSETGLSVTETTKQEEPKDTTAPVWPEGSTLSAAGVSQTGLQLNWTAAQDDTGVNSYKVYRGSTLIATVPGTTSSYNVSGLSSGTSYVFSVQAGDAAGNWSSNGPTVNVTTKSASSSSSTPPPVETTVPGKVKISAPVVDTAKGISKVTVDANELSRALTQAKVATVEIPKTAGMNAYVTSLPSSALVSGDASKAIQIVSEEAAVTLPLNMLSATDLAGADRIELSIEKSDAGELDSPKKAIVGDKPVFDIKLIVNGEEKAWSNAEAALTVKIPYAPTSIELANTEYLTVWYLSPDGQAVKMNDAKYVPSEKAMVFTTTHLSKYAVVYTKKDFLDMQKHSWAVEAVKALAENGIIEGTSGTEFSPAEKITREEYVAWLVRTLGMTADFNNNFSDVKETDKYYKEIGIAKELGISVGYKGEFSPEREISRQELVTMTINALKIADKPLEIGTAEDIKKYTDAGKIAKYATENMATMVRMGFITGNSKTTLNPVGVATRAEAAVILYKIYLMEW